MSWDFKGETDLSTNAVAKHCKGSIEENTDWRRSENKGRN